MTHPKHSRNPALSQGGSSGQGLSSSQPLSAPIPQHMPIGRNKQAMRVKAIEAWRKTMAMPPESNAWKYPPRKKNDAHWITPFAVVLIGLAVAASLGAVFVGAW